MAWRLGAVLLGSMVLVALVIGHYTWLAIDNLDDASLQIQAEQVASHVRLVRGEPTLQLPPTLDQGYHQAGDGYMYAVMNSNGKVFIASSDKARDTFGALPQDRLKAGDPIFRLYDPNGKGTPYYAYIMQVPVARELLVVVAQGYIHEDVYVDSLLKEFSEHIGWTLPVILIAALLISVLTIRTSLRPIKDLSARALMIGPATRDLRLPTGQVAEEILPLITAMNSALDRLDHGFEVQRRFTANAAHELRTPLAVLTARLAALDDTGIARDLGEDIARMNRLVSQLLLVSRLEAAPLRLEDDVDLNDLAATVIGYLAPLAIQHGRTIALQPSDRPVIRRTARIPLEDALRNLIENALAHAPAASEVTILVGDDGSIAVRDCGPGVTEEMRDQIFERFWRGRDRRGHGAGLGLAIVAETMRGLGGNVTVGNAPGGGAVFTLTLPEQPVIATP
ncbi:MAG: HAMP domain-containing sensor histidine kinase [Ferrovibrio sp.]